MRKQGESEPTGRPKIRLLIPLICLSIAPFTHELGAQEIQCDVERIVDIDPVLQQWLNSDRLFTVGDSAIFGWSPWAEELQSDLGLPFSAHRPADYVPLDDTGWRLSYDHLNWMEVDLNADGLPDRVIVVSKVTGPTTPYLAHDVLAFCAEGGAEERGYRLCGYIGYDRRHGTLSIQFAGQTRTHAERVDVNVHNRDMYFRLIPTQSTVILEVTTLFEFEDVVFREGDYWRLNESGFQLIQSC